MKMKLSFSIAQIFFTTCIGLISISVSAQTPANQPQPITVRGVNVQPLIEEIKKSIKVFQKPVLMYHWFTGNPKSVWTGKLKSTDPAGFQYINSVSQTFWNDFGNDQSGNMYGRGLYAAVDPIISQDFGYTSDWVLIEMRIPKGFRALDLYSSNGSLSTGMQDILHQLKCDGKNQLADYMSLRNGDQPECRDAIREILRDRLQIDGFLYSYAGAMMDACLQQGHGIYLPRAERNTALVVTSNRWLKPDLIRTFNSKTEDALDKRIQIESLYYLASANQTTGLAKNLSGALVFAYGQKILMSQNPGLYITNTNGSCDQSTCTYTATMCPIGGGNTSACKTLPMPTPPPQTYPPQISKDSIPLSHSESHPNLLWEDLNGKATAQNMDPWIQENLLGCSDGQLKSEP